MKVCGRIILYFAEGGGWQMHHALCKQRKKAASFFFFCRVIYRGVSDLYELRRCWGCSE